ncbi:MAG: hypothetical protein QOJ99_2313 [Bryobacterales bacterium]|nr:hypothetical protein [Bryobacterales bacterium]
MESIEAFVGIRMQNSGLGNPPIRSAYATPVYGLYGRLAVQQWGKTLPLHLRALTRTRPS